MTYKVAIQNNETKEIRMHSESNEWVSDFWWTEGNGACDCNRRIMFDEAGGDEEDPNNECSDHLYTVLYADLEDGARVIL